MVNAKPKLKINGDEAFSATLPVILTTQRQNYWMIVMNWKGYIFRPHLPNPEYHDPATIRVMHDLKKVTKKYDDHETSGALWSQFTSQFRSFVIFPF
jgi:hypothetical protein